MGDVLCGSVVITPGEKVYEIECGGAIGGGVKIVQKIIAFALCEVQGKN